MASAVFGCVQPFSALKKHKRLNKAKKVLKGAKTSFKKASKVQKGFLGRKGLKTEKMLKKVFKRCKQVKTTCKMAENGRKR